MPQMESNQIAMTLETEEGSSLDDTAKAADQVMDRIGKIEDNPRISADWYLHLI